MNCPTQGTSNALYGAGCWLLEQRRHEDAMHVFRTMLVVAPADERAWLGLGECHEELGELDRADALYALATSACGSALRCVVARARLLRATAREDEAQELYASAAVLAVASRDDEVLAIVDAEGRLS